MQANPVETTGDNVGYEFDNEQLYDSDTGKTVCDVDNPVFQKFLKEILKYDKRNIRE